MVHLDFFLEVHNEKENTSSSHFLNFLTLASHTLAAAVKRLSCFVCPHFRDPTSPPARPLGGPCTPALETTGGLSHPTLRAPCYYCLTRERAICKIKVASCPAAFGRFCGLARTAPLHCGSEAAAWM